MNIYCSKCGSFFKNWKLAIIECCDQEMKTLADPKLGEVIMRKASFHIAPDIQPYQAMAIDSKTGKAPMITSRRQHKEFLNRNNFVEVGNEMPKAQKAKADHNVRQELTQATHEVMQKYR